MKTKNRTKTKQNKTKQNILFWLLKPGSDDVIVIIFWSKRCCEALNDSCYTLDLYLSYQPKCERIQHFRIKATDLDLWVLKKHTSIVESFIDWPGWITADWIKSLVQVPGLQTKTIVHRFIEQKNLQCLTCSAQTNKNAAIQWIVNGLHQWLLLLSQFLTWFVQPNINHTFRDHYFTLCLYILLYYTLILTRTCWSHRYENLRLELFLFVYTSNLGLNLFSFLQFEASCSYIKVVFIKKECNLKSLRDFYKNSQPQIWYFEIGILKNIHATCR